MLEIVSGYSSATMKATLALTLSAAASLVSAHCECLTSPAGCHMFAQSFHSQLIDQFRNLIVNGTTTGDWVYNRMTANVGHLCAGPLANSLTPSCSTSTVVR